MNEIIYTDRTLKITGNHTEGHSNTKDPKDTESGLITNSISKSLELPTNILSNVSKITAKYDDGILDVVIPKKNGNNHDYSENKIDIH